MSNTLTKIHDKMSNAGIKIRTKASRDWFMRTLKNMRNIPRRTLLNDKLLKTRGKPRIGRMFMFFYDPKTKEKLPYYDTFPLIIMIAPAKGGFYGLNLHYLQPKLRAMFFDALLKYKTNKKYDHTTRLRLTYQLLQRSRKMRMFKPCFKRYLFSHVKSKIAEVPSNEWELAIFLPCDAFEGASRQNIWRRAKRAYLK
jgi:hypothetical protein